MESSQDKNLPATGRKLQKAREDGQVPRSRDLSHLAVMGTGALALGLMMPSLLERLEMTLTRHLRFDAQSVHSMADMGERLQGATLAGLVTVLPLGLLILAAALLSAVALGGWVLSSKPITPDLSRLDPISGIKRIFSKEQVSELFKVGGITLFMLGLGGWYLWKSLPELQMLILQPSSASLKSVANWLMLGLGLLLLVVAVVAAIDVPLQKFLHASRMKMSHEELRQEGKETEGNPHVKGRLRQRQREIAQRNSVANVPRADFVVMNPTHYAVALKYDDKTMGAPHVVAKGADLLALHIRDLARAHEVPVLQSPVLARALYAHAELNQEVPASLYTAVAQVLAYVYRLRAALRSGTPFAAELPEPQVPPELDPHHPLQAAAS